MFRALVPVAAAVIVLAACSTEESSPAATDPTATLPGVATTPKTVAATTTVTPDPTTTPPPATSTTVAPPPTEAVATTAAPPAPSRPTDNTVPLLLGGSSGGWLSLGAWASTSWEPAGDSGSAITAGTELAITGLQAGASAGVAGASVDACLGEQFGPSVDATVAAPTPPGFGYRAVALPTPSWTLQPRPVAVVAADIPAYQAAGEAAFAGEPVDATVGRVEQIVLADLDGDGDEEALVAFEHVDPAGIIGTPGDLAALILIDTATGASTTIESLAVGTGEDGEPTALTFRFRVLDVADLNGDGTMEVVVHNWYYEGAAAVVYAYDGTSLSGVLSAGCGS